MFKAWPWIEANKNRLIGAGVAAIFIWGVVYFLTSQKQAKEVEAGQAVTTLLTTPENGAPAQRASEFEQLAAKYVGTAAAQRARLQAAAILFDAGNYAEAQDQFQKFLNDSPSGFLAPTAELGLAAAAEAQNKLDVAAGAYQRVNTVFPSSTCVPEATFGLGRIAAQQGRLSDAVGYYEKVVNLVMGGALSQEAMLRASELRAKLAAAAPKAASAPKAPVSNPPSTAPQPTVPLTTKP